MVIKASRWSKDEILETNAALYGIIYLLWNYKHKAPTFEDLLWVISHANKSMFEKYTLNCVNVEIFNLFDFDEELIPANYVPKPLPENGWSYYLSQAQFEEIMRAFIKWKRYGRFMVKIKKLLWKR